MLNINIGHETLQEAVYIALYFTYPLQWWLLQSLSCVTVTVAVTVTVTNSVPRLQICQLNLDSPPARPSALLPVGILNLCCCNCHFHFHCHYHNSCCTCYFNCYCY